jgi:hypothetical protein
MAQNAKITVHPSYEIGEISDRLFSAFLEPIGTIVNGTMYNPKHPAADDQGPVARDLRRGTHRARERRGGRRLRRRQSIRRNASPPPSFCSASLALRVFSF